MRNRLIILSGLLIVTVAFPNYADAHSLKTDGSIGAVMHVNPEDDPIVGEESSFYFEFKDKNKTFEPKNCECTFSVLQNGKVLISQPLFQDTADPGLSHASASYYFPDRGVYTIRVSGQPKTEQLFSPFTLDYGIRVSRTTGSQTSQNKGNWFTEHVPHLIGGAIGLTLLGFFVFKNGRKKETR